MLLYPFISWSQDSLDISSCIEAAIRNHPRSEDRDLIGNVQMNKMFIAGAGWKPTVDLKAQASYQSDVIEIGAEIPLPGVEFPVPSKDQYKMYLEVNQTLYDGGRIRQQKILEEMSAQAEILKLETEIDNIKSEILDLFYSALQVQEKIKILGLTREILQEKVSLIESGIRNGIMMESDLDLVNIEVMGIDQEIKAADLLRKSLLTILGQKCGLELDENTALVQSNYSFKKSESERKELELFELQKNSLDAGRVMKDKTRMPVVFAFGQFGYGNPGLNMLNDQFDTYYYMGAGLKWNIWDWGTTRKEKENLLFQSRMVDNRKAEFLSGIRSALTAKESIIQTHIENIAAMEELVKLRREITGIYASRLNEGILQPSDYIEVTNQLEITMLKLAVEKILLQKSIAEYYYLNGEL